MSKIHTTETEATISYIIIPASARARLAHDMTTGRSPATHSLILLPAIKLRFCQKVSIT